MRIGPHRNWKITSRADRILNGPPERVGLSVDQLLAIDAIVTLSRDRNLEFWRTCRNGGFRAGFREIDA